MIFFKHTLITLTVLAIAIWVMPASADREEKLIQSCERILTIVGYKDSRNDFLNVEKYRQKTYGENEIVDLNAIYLKIAEEHHLKFEKPLTAGELNIAGQPKKLDSEKIKKVANELGIRFSNYMKNVNPATIFCDVKIEENRSYLKNVVN